jgi:hypothetical protein
MSQDRMPRLTLFNRHKKNRDQGFRCQRPIVFEQMPE